MESLRGKQVFLCDMDGVIYHGDWLLPGHDPCAQRRPLPRTRKEPYLHRPRCLILFRFNQTCAEPSVPVPA